MSVLVRFLIITFAESFATTLIERGIYFYSHDRLGFGDMENLGLALGFGAAYVSGAVASHALASRVSEKRLMIFSIVAQILCHFTLFCWPFSPVVVVAMNTLLGGLNGLKWPVIESYISAGRTPSQQAVVVGKFNLGWSVPIPLALLVAGPLIAWWASSLFALAGLMNLVSLALAWPADRRPTHLAEDHPERPTPEAMARYRGLLAASRSTMFGSYSLLWVLAALLPGVYAGLDVSVQWATALSGAIDVVRAVTFLVMQLYVGWHFRRLPIVWVIFGLPLGFFAALYGPNVATVLAGEVLFGAMAGMTYYAALYYAMVVKNAAVEAGGAHEGLIGAAFVVGPVAGLLGRLAAPAVGGAVLGMAVGIGPVILACGAAAAWFLVKTGRSRPR